MRTKLLVFVSVSMCVLALSVTGAARDDRHGDQDGRSKGHDEKKSADDKRIEKGFEIAPVPLHFRRQNRDRVGLGSYLVNATGGCNDCHTSPGYVFGGDPFVGQVKQVNAKRYLAGGAVFGPFTSRNITPDANGLPAGRTFDEFLQVMRHGTDLAEAHPALGPLLQVMPWPVYQDLKTSDLRAIYEYLKAIPHAEPCAAVGPGQTDLSCKTMF